MVNTVELSLRDATINDLQLLAHWDKQQHIIEARNIDSDSNDDWNWSIELQRALSWRELLIAELNDRPIGFMQIIDPAEEESHYWGNIGPNYRAIDIWIGEKTDIGKGYGTVMFNLALERCFHNPNVVAVILDPLESNTRAQKFYTRFGFVIEEKRRFGDDDCIVMKLERSNWKRNG